MFNIFNMGVGMVLALDESEAQKAIDILAVHGDKATVIGRVTDTEPGIVSMKTAIGGSRLVDWLNSDPLPRIC